MPISAANKKRYPKDWPAISARIRERAGNKCETCHAPNNTWITRGQGSDIDTFMMMDGEVINEKSGERVGYARGSEYNAHKLVKIVLTVAHLDHTPENNADDNLKALCQRCHLAHDQKHHQANAAETRRSRKAVRDLFS